MLNWSFVWQNVRRIGQNCFHVRILYTHPDMLAVIGFPVDILTPYIEVDINYAGCYNTPFSMQLGTYCSHFKTVELTYIYVCVCVCLCVEKQVGITVIKYFTIVAYTGAFFRLTYLEHFVDLSILSQILTKNIWSKH